MYVSLKIKKKDNITLNRRNKQYKINWKSNQNISIDIIVLYLIWSISEKFSIYSIDFFVWFLVFLIALGRLQLKVICCVPFSCFICALTYPSVDYTPFQLIILQTLYFSVSHFVTHDIHLIFLCFNFFFCIFFNIIYCYLYLYIECDIYTFQGV